MRAGEKYEQLRRALVKVFDWRGVAAPDTCADVTIDRVARKLDGGAIIDDVTAFAYGVARLVVLEQGRRPETRHVTLDEAISVEGLTPHPVEEDERLPCLERCLGELDTDARTLILSYYVHARQDRIRARAALASRMGLTQNALRSRAQRIRDRLERCTNACAGEELSAREP
jgi:DNA-directed RNA polymerase specialized sigma24 family protein